jgi:hypothetical protein
MELHLISIARHLRLAVAMAWLVGAGQLAADEPSQAFARLLDDAWQFALREDPLFATSTGDYRFNDKLPQESLADQQRRIGGRSFSSG